MKSLFLPLATVALLLGGCATVNTTQTPDVRENRQMIADERLITDAGTDGIARILGVNVADNGFLRVQVELENRRARMFTVHYKFEWYDQNGMLVQPDGPWKTRQLEGRETVVITDVAPTPQAKDFRLKLLQNVRRSPDPTFPNTR